MTMKKEMVGDVPGNVLGMMADLCHKLRDGTLTPQEMALFLKRENPFSTDFGGLLRQWEKFYQKYLGLENDFSELKIPQFQEGFGRLLVIAQGLTPNQVFGACQKEFSCWRYTEDLDEAVRGRNDRESNESYAIWVRDRIEPDEELKNLSANRLRETGINCITLLERLVYELKFWSETRKQLDVVNWTLCAGSRYSYGSVPIASWFDDMFKVYWFNPDNASGGLCARSVVSC